jgi:hypothetical protein
MEIVMPWFMNTDGKIVQHFDSDYVEEYTPGPLKVLGVTVESRRSKLFELVLMLSFLEHLIH